MKILSIKAKNLLSFSNLYIKFQDSGLVLVEGWNYDDGRANGAGKTAIFNLACLALYQKLPRKINISEVLKYGERRAFVEVEVLVGGDTYTARYGRPKARSFTKNSEPIEISQQEFEDTIGLSYEQFLVSMYTAQGGGNKFLDLNDTRKKDFLLDLMNLKNFAEYRRKADAKVKCISKKIDDIKVKIEKARSKIEAYSESQVNETDIKYEIECAQADIADFKGEIQKHQSVPKPDLSKFYDLESKINKKKEKFVSLRAQRMSLSSQHSSLETQAAAPFVESEPDAACPSCNAELRVRGKSIALVEDQQALRDQHNKHVDEIKSQMADVKLKIDEIDQQLYEEKSVKNLEDKVKLRKEKESSRYESAKGKIAEINYLIRDRESKISGLKKTLSQQAEIAEKIQTLRDFIKESSKVLKKHQHEQEEYKAVSQMFSPTGAPAYMMDSVVETFNEAVNEHISMIWPSASYELKSHKENSTGEIVAKFSETLIINGQNRSIGALSGGENRAFSLAIDFAVIDVLSRQFGMPLNPVVMDEPFEGLDATGREVVIELLERLSADRQIWVIDHASESKAMFSQILRVEKRNGTSEIVTL